jgi:hypothetical protein
MSPYDNWWKSLTQEQQAWVERIQAIDEPDEEETS